MSKQKKAPAAKSADNVSKVNNPATPVATPAPAAKSNPAPVVKKKREAFKLDPKRLAKMEQVVGIDEEDGELEEGGKIDNILRLYVKGFNKREIVLFGFNKSTVYRQCAELDKYKKAPALQYYGHDLYEARIQRLMAAKKIGRDKAVEIISGKDLDRDIDKD